MKEIIRIHLARTSFDIEIEARKLLENYLEAIQKALHADEEAMREIEARVVEILHERGVPKDGTITRNDVDAITKQLGEPSEFSDEDESEAAAKLGQKRLMRDQERGMLGGVCAGISDYFGINVMWPRLIAVLLTFISFGTALIVYAVLWLVIPAAKTAADKLQMRGEPVTLASLKAETSDAAVTVRERSKPLVIVLRVILGLGFVLLALGAICVIIAAIFVREPLFGSSMHDFATGGTLSILAGAYIAAICAGVLFVVLMVLAAYTSFAWVLNKRLLVSGGIIIVLGLTSFVTAIGLGSYGVNQVNQHISQLQTSDTTSEKILQSAKSIQIDNNEGVQVNYIVGSGTPRITLGYLKGYQKPTVKFTNANGVLHITVNGTHNCQDAQAVCAGYDSVTFYGPAITNLEAVNGTVNYTADRQAALSVHVKHDADIELGGTVSSLMATVDEGALLEAQDASVRNVQLTLAQTATANFGTVVGLAVTAPEACGTDGGGVLTYVDATKLTINGQMQKIGTFDAIRSQPNSACLQVSRNE